MPRFHHANLHAAIFGNITCLRSIFSHDYVHSCLAGAPHGLLSEYPRIPAPSHQPLTPSAGAHTHRQIQAIPHVLGVHGHRFAGQESCRRARTLMVCNARSATRMHPTQ